MANENQPTDPSEVGLSSTNNVPFRGDAPKPGQIPFSQMDEQGRIEYLQKLSGVTNQARPPKEQSIFGDQNDQNNYAVNNYGSEGWLESWQKSWYSGVGDAETSMAGFMKAMGFDDAADEWYNSGMNRIARNQNYVSKELGEFSADDLLNPYYYSKIMGRSLPSNAILTGASVGAAIATGGTSIGLQALGITAARSAATNIVIDQLTGGDVKGMIVPGKGKILQTLMASGLATAGEAFLEGGGLYKQLIEEGVDEATAKDAFNKTVAANMMLGVTNLAQFAQFFNPVAKGIMKGGAVSETIEAFQKRFLNGNTKKLVANTLTEGLEEVYQGAIQRKAQEGGSWGDFALGLPGETLTSFTNAEGWGEFAAGAVFGGAMGGTSAAYQKISGKSLAYKETVDKLSDARLAVEDGDWMRSTRPFVGKMFEVFESQISGGPTVGVKVGDQIVPGLYQITPDKLKVLMNAIPGIIENKKVAAEVTQRMGHLVDKATEAFNVVNSVDQIKNLDRNTKFKLFESIYQQDLIDLRIEKAKQMNFKDDVRDLLITSLEREKIGIKAVQESIVAGSVSPSQQFAPGNSEYEQMNPLSPEEKIYHDLLDNRVKGQKTLDPALKKMGVNKEIRMPGLNPNEKNAYEYLNARLQTHGFTDKEGNVTKPENPVDVKAKEDRIRSILGNDQVLLDEAKQTAGTSTPPTGGVNPVSTTGNPYGLVDIPAADGDSEKDKIDSVMAKRDILSVTSNVSSTRNFVANGLKNELKREYERLVSAAKAGKYSPALPHVDIPYEEFINSVKAKAEQNQETTPFEQKFSQADKEIQGAINTPTSSTRKVYQPSTPVSKPNDKPSEPVAPVDKTEQIRNVVSTSMIDGKSQEIALKENRKKIRQRLKVTDEDIDKAMAVGPIEASDVKKAKVNAEMARTSIAQAFAEKGQFDKNVVLTVKIEDGTEVPVYAKDDFGYMVQALLPKVVLAIDKIVSEVNQQLGTLSMEDAYNRLESTEMAIKEILLNAIGSDITDEQYRVIDSIASNLKPVIEFTEGESGYQVSSPLYIAARELSKNEQYARANQYNLKTFSKEFAGYLSQMPDVQNDEDVAGMFDFYDEEFDDSEKEESGKVGWEGKDRIDEAVTISIQFGLAVKAKLKKMRVDAKIDQDGNVYTNDVTNINKTVQSLFYSSSSPYEVISKIDKILNASVSGGNPISMIDEQVYKAIRDTFYELHTIVSQTESDNGVPNIAKITSVFNTIRTSYAPHVMEKTEFIASEDGSIKAVKLNKDKQFFAINNAISTAVQQVYNESENKSEIVSAVQKVKTVLNSNKPNRSDVINAITDLIGLFSNDKFLEEVFDSAEISIWLESFKNPSKLYNAAESIAEIFSDVKTSDRNKQLSFTKFRNMMIGKYMGRKSVIYGNTTELQYYDRKQKKMLSAIENNVKPIHDLTRLQNIADAYTDQAGEVVVDKNVETVVAELEKGDMQGTAQVETNERGVQSFIVKVVVGGQEINLPLAGIKTSKDENKSVMQAWNKSKAKNPDGKLTLKLNQTKEVYNDMEYPYSIEVYSGDIMIGKTRIRDFKASTKEKSWLQSLTKEEHGSLSEYNSESFLMNPLLAIKQIFQRILVSNPASMSRRRGDFGTRYENFSSDDLFLSMFGMFNKSMAGKEIFGEGDYYSHLVDIKGKPTAWQFNLPTITSENGKYVYSVEGERIGAIQDEKGMFMKLVQYNYDRLSENGKKKAEAYFPSFIKIQNGKPVFNEASVNQEAKKAIQRYIRINTGNLLTITSANVNEINAINRIQAALADTVDGNINFKKAEDLLNTLEVSDRFVAAVTKSIQNLKLNGVKNIEQNAKDFIVSHGVNEFFLKHYYSGNVSGYDNPKDIDNRKSLMFAKGLPGMDEGSFNIVIADKGFYADIKTVVNGKDIGIDTKVFDGQTYYRGDFSDKLSFMYGHGHGYSSLFKTALTPRDSSGNIVGIKSASESLTFENTANDPVKRAIYNYMLENDVQVFTFKDNEKTKGGKTSQLKYADGKITGEPVKTEAYFSDVRVQTVLDNKKLKGKQSKQALTMLTTVNTPVTESAKKTAYEAQGTIVETQSALELLDNKLIVEAFKSATTSTDIERGKIIEYLRKKLPNLTKDQLKKFGEILNNVNSAYTSENDADKYGELIASSFRKAAHMNSTGTMMTFVSNPTDNTPYMELTASGLKYAKVKLPGYMRKMFNSQDNARVFVQRSPFNNPSMGMFADVEFDDSFEESKVILPNAYVALQNADFDGDQGAITILNNEAEQELTEMLTGYGISTKVSSGTLALYLESGKITEQEYRSVLKKMHEVAVNKLNNSIERIYSEPETWKIIEAGLDLEGGFIAALKDLGMNEDTNLSMYSPMDIADSKEMVGAGTDSIGVFAMQQRLGGLVSQEGITSEDPIYSLMYNGEVQSGSDIIKSVDDNGNSFAKLSGEVVQTATDTLKNDYHQKAGINTNNYLWYMNLVTRFNFGLSTKETHSVAIQTINQPIAKLLYYLQGVNSKSGKSREFSTVYDNKETAIAFLRNIVNQYGLETKLDDLVTAIDYSSDSGVADLSQFIGSGQKLNLTREEALQMFTNPSFANKAEAEAFVMSQKEALKAIIQLDHISQPFNTLIGSYKVIEDIPKTYNEAYVKLQRLMSLGLMPNVLGIDGYSNIKARFKLAEKLPFEGKVKNKYEDIKAAYDYLNDGGVEPLTVKEHRAMGMTEEMMKNYFSLLYRYENGRVFRNSANEIVEYQPLLYDNPGLNAQMKNLFMSMATMQSISPVYSQSFRDYTNETIRRLHNASDIRTRPQEINQTVEKFQQHVFEEATKETLIKQLYSEVPGLDANDMTVLHNYMMGSDVTKIALTNKLAEIAAKSEDAKKTVAEIEFIFSSDGFNSTFNDFLLDISRYRIKMNNPFVNAIETINSQYEQRPIAKVNEKPIYTNSKYYFDGGVLVSTTDQSLKEALEPMFAQLRGTYPNAANDKEFYNSIIATPNASYNVAGISKDTLIEFAQLLAAQEELVEGENHIELTLDTNRNVIYDTYSGKVFSYKGEMDASRTGRIFTDLQYGGAINNAFMFFKDNGSDLSVSGVKSAIVKMQTSDNHVTPRYKPLSNIRATVSGNGNTYSFNEAGYADIASGIDTLKQDLTDNKITDEGNLSVSTIMEKVQDMKRAFLFYELTNRNWNTFKPYIKMLGSDMEALVSKENINFVHSLKNGTVGNSSDIIAKLVRKNPEVTRYVSWFKVQNNSFDMGDSMVSYFHTEDDEGATRLMTNLVLFNTENIRLNERKTPSLRIAVTVQKINTDGETFRLEQANPVDKNASDLINYALMGNTPTNVNTAILYEVSPGDVIRAVNRIITGKTSYKTPTGKEIDLVTIDFSGQVDNDNPKTREIRALAARAFKAERSVPGTDKPEGITPLEQLEAYKQLMYKLHEMSLSNDEFVKLTPDQMQVCGAIYNTMTELSKGQEQFDNSVIEALSEETTPRGDNTNMVFLSNYEGQMKRKGVSLVTSTNVNISPTGTSLQTIKDRMWKKIFGGNTKTRKTVRDFASRHFGNISDIKNLNDLIGLFTNQLNKDGGISVLARHIQQRLGNAKVSLVDNAQFAQYATQFGFNANDVPMFYDSNTKQIVVNADFNFKSNDTGSEISRYIIHEAMHRLVNEAVDSNAQFSGEVDTVFKQFLANFDTVANSLPAMERARLQEIRNAILAETGNDQLKEFISYAFTEPAMRTAMGKMTQAQGVSGSSESSVWTKFLDVLKKFFGITKGDLFNQFSELMNYYDQSLATDKLSGNQIAYKNGRSITEFVKQMTYFFDEDRISSIVANSAGKTQQQVLNDWDNAKNLGIEKQNLIMDLMKVQKGVFRNLQTAREHFITQQRGKKFADNTYAESLLRQFNADVLRNINVPLVDKEVQDNAFEVVGKTNMEYYDDQGVLHIRDFTFASHNGTGMSGTGQSSALGLSNTKALVAYLKLATYGYIREVQGEKVGSIAVMKLDNKGRWYEENLDFAALKEIVKRELEVKAMNPNVSSQWTAMTELMNGKAEFYDEMVIKQFAAQINNSSTDFKKAVPFDRFMELIGVPMDAPKGRDAQIAKDMYETAAEYYNMFKQLVAAGSIQELTYEQISGMHSMLLPFQNALPDAGAFDALSSLVYREYYDRKMEKDIEELTAKGDMSLLDAKVGRSVVDVSDDYAPLKQTLGKAQVDFNNAVAEKQTWSAKYKKLANEVAVEQAGGKLKMYIGRYFGFGKGLEFAFKSLYDYDQQTGIQFIISKDEARAKVAKGEMSQKQFELHSHMMGFYEKHKDVITGSRKTEYGYSRLQTLLNEGKFPVPFYEATMSQYISEKGLTKEFLSFKKKVTGPDAVNVKYVNPYTGAQTMATLDEAKGLYTSALKDGKITQAQFDTAIKALTDKATRLLATGKHDDGQQIDFTGSAIQSLIAEGELMLPKYEPKRGRSRTHNMIGVFDAYADALAFKGAMDKHATAFQILQKMNDMTGNKKHLATFMKDIWTNKFQRHNTSVLVDGKSEQVLAKMNYLTSVIILGGNFIAGAANIAIGKMNNIVATGFKDYAKAEGRILNHRKRALAMTTRFNLGADLDDTITSIGQSNIRKLINDGMFISHIAGERWIKNAHALALVPDSVWNSYDDNGNFTGGTELTPEMITNIKNEVEQVQGKYDFFTKRIHNHDALLSAFMKFKGFMIDQVSWKFGKERTRIDGSIREEGYWRTSIGALGIPIYNFFAEIGGFDSKDPYTRAEIAKNAPKVLREVAMVYLLVLGAGVLFGGEDDEEKLKNGKLAKFQDNMFDTFTVFGSPDKVGGALKMGIPTVVVAGNLLQTAWSGVSQTKYEADGKYGKEGEIKFWSNLSQVLPMRSLTRELVINEEYGKKKKSKKKSKKSENN